VDARPAAALAEGVAEPPPMWPLARPTTPVAPELVPLRRGPHLRRPLVQESLWAALLDVLRDGRGRRIVLVGPDGSGRRTVARALLEAAREHGLTDADGSGPVRVEIRDDGPVPPRTLVLARATAPPASGPWLRLPRVETTALAAMLRGLTPLAPSLAGALAAAADGNPGIARALLDRLVARGALAPGTDGLVSSDDPLDPFPPALRRAAEATLDALCPDPGDRDALQLGAALGEGRGGIVRTVWARVLGEEPAALIARAASAAVLEDAGPALRFLRPDVVWVLAQGPRARQAHRRCAAWLGAHGGDPADIGRHLARAHAWDAALDALLAAPGADPALLREAVHRLGLAPDDARRRRAEARG
jgi:hypothetical protein